MSWPIALLMLLLCSLQMLIGASSFGISPRSPWIDVSEEVTAVTISTSCVCSVSVLSASSPVLAGVTPSWSEQAVTAPLNPSSISASDSDTLKDWKEHTAASISSVEGTVLENVFLHSVVAYAGVDVSSTCHSLISNSTSIVVYPPAPMMFSTATSSSKVIATVMSPFRSVVVPSISPAMTASTTKAACGKSSLTSVNPRSSAYKMLLQSLPLTYESTVSGNHSSTTRLMPQFSTTWCNASVVSSIAAISSSAPWSTSWIDTPFSTSSQQSSAQVSSTCVEVSLPAWSCSSGSSHGCSVHVNTTTLPKVYTTSVWVSVQNGSRAVSTSGWVSNVWATRTILCPSCNLGKTVTSYVHHTTTTWNNYSAPVTETLLATAARPELETTDSYSGDRWTSWILPGSDRPWASVVPADFANTSSTLPQVSPSLKETTPPSSDMEPNSTVSPAATSSASNYLSASTQPESRPITSFGTQTTRTRTSWATRTLSTLSIGTGPFPASSSRFVISTPMQTSQRTTSSSNSTRSTSPGETKTITLAGSGDFYIPGRDSVSTSTKNEVMWRMLIVAGAVVLGTVFLFT